MPAAAFSGCMMHRLLSSAAVVKIEHRLGICGQWEDPLEVALCPTLAKPLGSMNNSAKAIGPRSILAIPSACAKHSVGGIVNPVAFLCLISAHSAHRCRD